jgi:hypothetical protein
LRVYTFLVGSAYIGHWGRDLVVAANAWVLRCAQDNNKVGIRCQVLGDRASVFGVVPAVSAWVVRCAQDDIWISVARGSVLTSRRSRKKSVALEEAGLVDGSRNGDIEESDHHLVVGLVSPADGAFGIGIVGVVAGIVVPGDGLQLGSGLQ